MNAIEIESQIKNDLNEICNYYDERIFSGISLNKYYETMQFACNYESEFLLLSYVSERVSEIKEDLDDFEWEYPCEEDYESEEDYDNAIEEHHFNYRGTNYYEDDVIQLFLISNYLNDKEKFERVMAEKQASLLNLSLFNRDEYILDNTTSSSLLVP